MVPKVKLLKILRYFVFMYNLFSASGYGLAQSSIQYYKYKYYFGMSMYVWVFFFC